MSKIAIVTGASRGLGRNTALNIARKGSDVIITYQSREDEAQAVVRAITAMGRKAAAFQLDVGNVATFKSFAEGLRATLRQTWQRETFDHLVNNAGHGDMAMIAETTEAQFDKLVDVHFKGVFFLTQALLPLIADGGRIVNLSSGLTRVSFPGFSAYSAVKGAVEVLSVYMAKELGSRGIAVNTVAPGATRTDGSKYASGYWAEEFVVIHEKLAAAGCSIDIATPEGRKPTADARSLDPIAGASSVTSRTAGARIFLCRYRVCPHRPSSRKEFREAWERNYAARECSCALSLACRYSNRLPFGSSFLAPLRDYAESSNHSRETSYTRAGTIRKLFTSWLTLRFALEKSC